jgi:thioredoxin:protein disulfide reductase
MRWLRFMLLILSAIALAPVGLASDKNPFRVEVEDLRLAPGATGALRVTLAVPADHHVYRDMMDATVTDAAGLSFGPASFPPGQQAPDPANPAATREMFDTDVIIEVPLSAAPAVGTYQVGLQVRYQGCRKTLCWMPATEDLTATVIVGDGKAAAGEGGAPAEDAGLTGPAVRVAAGPAEAGVISVSVELLDGWHVTRNFMGLGIVEGGVRGPDGAAAPGVFTLGEPTLPEGVPYVDPATQFERIDLNDAFTMTAPLTGPEGTWTIDLMVYYQACRETLCKMPDSLPLTVVATIGSGGAADLRAASAAPAAPGDMLSGARDAGILQLLGLVFVAGLGVSLTPCVLPMVPITIGIIGARSAGSRLKAVSLSGAYVLGLALVYSGLGVAAGATGMMFGAWMQSPLVVGTIAILFFGMGLSMFGLFEVGVPGSIQTKLSQYGGAGYGGALVLGMVGALVAGPCSGPVLISIIALIGQKGELLLGAGLMMVFSLGMGVIFLVSGAFSTTLLRPGAWMDTVKKSFGLFMWAGALYFASPHLPVWAAALVAGFMLLVTGVFAWPDPEAGDGYWVDRSRRLYSIAGGVVGGYLLLGVLITEGFILPPLSLGGGGTAVAQGPAIPWGDDEGAALARAAAEGKPVMLDFTADWCAACKELEHFTYTDPTVIAAAGKMVPLMIDATNDRDPEVAALVKKYGVRGLPTVKFLQPDGTPIEALTVTGFLPAEEFLPHMEKALAHQ